MLDLLVQASIQTLIMVFMSTLIAVVIGLPLGIRLVLSQKDGLEENLALYGILSSIINLLRSVPFIILMLLLFPLSRLILGTSIGTKAAVIPLSISASPFVARLIEQNINSVEKGKIDAAISMGASTWEVIRMQIKEAMPAIINSITTTTVNIIGYSAMAGSIGGGGLGDTAIRYGVYRGETKTLWLAVILLVIFVQIIQFIGTSLAKAVNKK